MPLFLNIPLSILKAILAKDLPFVTRTAPIRKQSLRSSMKVKYNV